MSQSLLGIAGIASVHVARDMNTSIKEKTVLRSTDKVDKMETLVEVPNEEEAANAPKKLKENNENNENQPTSMKSVDNVDLKIPALDKYNLRTKSIQNRIETERKRKNPRKDPKPKQRPPPLSKYRRRTANARERGRMQEINDAFEELKRVVPQFPKVPTTNEKLTKITTLRLAVNYIAALTQILKQTDSQMDNDNLRIDNGVDRDTNNNNDTAQASDCDILISSENIVEEIENLLKYHHRPSSGSSSDIPSCSSPSTSTETESLQSLESLKSSCGNWDFSADESLDVPDSFDLIFESDESLQLSDDPMSVNCNEKR